MARGVELQGLLVEALAALVLFGVLSESAWRASRAGWSAYPALWSLVLLAPPSLAAAAGWMTRGELDPGLALLARISPLASLPLAGEAVGAPAPLAPALGVALVLLLATHLVRPRGAGVS